MKIIAHTGNDNLAAVYIAETEVGRCIEFVESVQPPRSRDEKWVNIVSTLYGCPGKCRFCDAGHFYYGKLSAEDILAQLDFLVDLHFPDKKVNTRQWKIQFARMGDPAYNPAVIDVLRALPERFDAPGLFPSVSTIGPRGASRFFNQLTGIRDKLYRGRFQLQFSIHTTDRSTRDWLIPVPKMGFAEMAEYGRAFHRPGERKVTLNFALADNLPVSATKLLEYFDPEVFLIKITPVNPTHRAKENDILTNIRPEDTDHPTIRKLADAGYQVVFSFGEREENNIGSNCGQFLRELQESRKSLGNAYNYPLRTI